jgi:hypothetical protein
MICPKCDTASDEKARFCPFCGNNLIAVETQTEVEKPESGETTSAPTATVHYAGFWRRFLALFIDEIILGAVSLFFPRHTCCL